MDGAVRGPLHAAKGGCAKSFGFSPAKVPYGDYKTLCFIPGCAITYKPHRKAIDLWILRSTLHARVAG
jgi:hypothetical protein